MFFDENVDGSTVNNNHGLFSIGLLRIEDGYFFIRFVDHTNKLECNLVLEIDTEMGEEEDGLFDDSHICFQDKLFLETGLNVLKKVFFFRGFEWNAFKLILFSFDVMFHFVTEFPWKLVMIPELIDGLLIIVKLFVFLLDLVDCNTYNVDHVTENGSSNKLNNHNDKNFNIILGR